MLSKTSLKVSCLDVAYPEPPTREIFGDIQGRCPFPTCRHYGSTDGARFFMKKDGSSWYCARCRTGGGVISALAVKSGIISCKEAGRPLTKKEEDQLKQIIGGLKNER